MSMKKRSDRSEKGDMKERYTDSSEIVVVEADIKHNDD